MSTNSEYAMAEALSDGDETKIMELMNKPGFNIDDIIKDRENARLTPLQFLVYEVNMHGYKKDDMDVFIPVLTSFMELGPSEQNKQKAIEIVDYWLDESSDPKYADIHASLLRVKKIIENGPQDEDPGNLQDGGRKKNGKKSRKSKKTCKSKKTRKDKKSRKSKKTRKSKKSRK